MRDTCGIARLALLFALINAAAGDHFHYATLSWQLVSGTTVKFWLTSAWETDFQPFLDQAEGNITVGQTLQVQGLKNPVLMFGDGQDSFTLVKAEVVGVDNVLGMWRGVFSWDHTYPAPGEPNHAPTYTASFSGCCRDFSVETLVDMNAAMYSPRIAVLPRQVIFTQSNASFYVAAYDLGDHPSQQGLPGKFEWSLESASSAYTIDAASGLVTAVERAPMEALKVRVTEPLSGVFSTVEFEVEQLNLTVQGVPAMDPSYPPTRLPLPATNELVASFASTFTLRFTVPGAGSWELVLSSGELPAGAALGPARMAPNMFNGTAGFESDFTWTPGAEQAGWTAVCVQAYNRGVSPPVGSPQYCFDFVVLTDAAPALEVTLPPELSGPAGVPVEWSMGQSLNLTLTATDRMASGIDIVAVGGLPSGAALSALVQRQDSAEMTATRTLTWEPDPKAGGSTGTLCFQATDGAAGSGEVCVEYRVPKCMYKVRGGEALVEVAGRFGTSWLQLWALNKGISRPEGHGLDGAVYEGMDLHVGQLVLVKEGDTLERIAARFGTTLRQIVNLNAEMTPMRQLLTGQLVCLVPSSCAERA